MKAIKVKKDNRYILYDADCVENPELLGFNADYWASKGAIIGFAEGRGTTFFVQSADQHYALRHYRRGGMIARVSSDMYVWTGLQRTRAWREWHLLSRMQQMGLPVPQPVAVQVERNGVLYSADIMTRRIPNATTLAKKLEQQVLPRDTWQELGKVIRQFHLRGVWHADLNANNVMINEDRQIFLIDFDRGRLRRPVRHWQQANLQRLKRSLLKLQGRADSFYYNASDWQALLDGYSAEALD